MYIQYGPGYTISIQKGTEYQRIDTLRAEVERLCAWSNRIVPDTAFLLSIPADTHYTKQSAVVTIFDPVMQKIERYIPGYKMHG